MTDRLEFTDLVPEGESAATLVLASRSAGAIIAVIVQPTIGSISDYPIPLGPAQAVHLRRLILDVVFLIGSRLATRDRHPPFLALLQFSSNFAQGPFQGYMPDLVPAPQVGPQVASWG